MAHGKPDSSLFRSMTLTSWRVTTSLTCRGPSERPGDRCPPDESLWLVVLNLNFLKYLGWLVDYLIFLGWLLSAPTRSHLASAVKPQSNCSQTAMQLLAYDSLWSLMYTAYPSQSLKWNASPSGVLSLPVSGNAGAKRCSGEHLDALPLWSGSQSVGCSHQVAASACVCRLADVAMHSICVLQILETFMKSVSRCLMNIHEPPSSTFIHHPFRHYDYQRWFDSAGWLCEAKICASGVFSWSKNCSMLCSKSVLQFCGCTCIL